MAKRNEIAKVTIDIDAGTATWVFADKGPNVVIDLADISAANTTRLTLHGIKQKGSDSYAGTESVADAREAVLAIQEMLYTGDWSTRAPGEPRQSVLAEAVARAQSITLEAAKKVLADVDAADALLADEDKNKGAVRKAIMGHPSVKLARAQIAMEKAQKELVNAPAFPGA